MTRNLTRKFQGRHGPATSGIAELQLGNDDPGTAEPQPCHVSPGIAELQLGPSLENQEKPGWHSRGYLPHFDANGLIQHITFHLRDSLPGPALELLEASIAAMPEDERKQLRRQKYQDLLDAGCGSCVLRNPESARLVQGALLHFDSKKYRLLAWVIMPNHVHVLVEPLPGFCVARIVQSWKSFTARRINSWMADGMEGSAGPGNRNGIRRSKGGEGRAGARRSQDQHTQEPLTQGQRSQKQIPQEQRSQEQIAQGKRFQNRRSRSLWQRDYWDRFIRNERHLLTAIRYIEQNPMEAGLISSAEDWVWGSANCRWQDDRTIGRGVLGGLTHIDSTDRLDEI